MATVANRDITKLKPVIQRGFTELKRRFDEQVIIGAINGAYAPSAHKITIAVSEGVRSKERQSEMVAQGKSLTMDSNHLKGLAFDIYISGYGDNIYPEVFLNLAGKIWQEMGGTWGGEWKSIVDKVHFEYTNGDKMPWEKYIHLNDNIEQGTNTVSKFATDAWHWAIKNNITDGSNPREMATREQVVTMLYRAMKKDMIE